MNTFTLLLFVALVVLTTAAPRDYETHPANVARRSPQYTKGKIPVRAGYAPKATVEGSIGNTANPSLRKGEYMCGDKICKLQRGEIPKGCNGMCQYKVK